MKACATLKNPKAKGSRNERRSIALFEACGFETMKSGGSLGAWDLCAYNHACCIFVQVKSNQWPSAAEMETLRDAIVPIWAVKLIHLWRDGARLPEVRKL